MTKPISTDAFDNSKLIDEGDDGKSTPVFGEMSPFFLGKELISANSLCSMAPREYLVKDLLLFGQVSMLAGPPNTGKTSVIAMIAGHAALGEAIGDRKVTQAGTLYVAAEDPIGVAERGSAVLGKRRSEALPFDIIPSSIDLTDSVMIERFGQELGRYMKARGLEKIFIVFDTLNLCLGDGDENSSRDMGKAISNAQKLALEHNAHVMIVHHATHSDPEKPRGSSAMIGNCDTLLVLNEARTTEGEAVIAVQQKKQRSLARGEPLMFKIASIEVGQDTDGDPITLPVAQPVVGATPMAKQPKGGSSSDSDARAHHLLHTLREMEQEKSGAFHSATTLRSKVAGPFNALLDKPDSLRKAIARAIDSLLKQGLIEKADDGSIRVKS